MREPNRQSRMTLLWSARRVICLLCMRQVRPTSPCWMDAIFNWHESSSVLDFKLGSWILSFLLQLGPQTDQLLGSHVCSHPQLSQFVEFNGSTCIRQIHAMRERASCGQQILEITHGHSRLSVAKRPSTWSCSGLALVIFCFMILHVCIYRYMYVRVNYRNIRICLMLSSV